MTSDGVRFAVIFLSLAVAGLPAETPSTSRVTATFDGIECEYSPGREELARLLAHRFVVHNQEIAATQAAQKSVPEPLVPLSPAEMRANRAAYLGGIAAQLGLAKVTSLQEECYDAFLDNYEQMMAAMVIMRNGIDTLQVIKRFMIWDRDDLIRRLGAGEALAGFSYDSVTKKGDVTFGISRNWQDDRFKDLAAKREKLRRDYRMSIGQEGGKTVYRGSVSPKRPALSAADATANQPADAGKSSELFPVVIPSELAAVPAAELVQKLWDGRGGDSLAAMLAEITTFKDKISLVDPTIAFVVLHETTELGIMDHYFHGSDRRWFCDGIANYVPWRVVRDLHGEPLATTVYDLADQLVRSAPMREQADLRKWPATENQSEEDQHSELNGARYAFAANAVFLMHQQEGEDILPRLFHEIGRTKPDKVSIRTVEKAWQKLTGTKLDTILAEAVKPLPEPAADPQKK